MYRRIIKAWRAEIKIKIWKDITEKNDPTGQKPETYKQGNEAGAKHNLVQQSLVKQQPGQSQPGRKQNDQHT